MTGISGEEEALLARLDRAFAYQRAGLTARQREVVRLWQRTDREYEAIQAVARKQVAEAGMARPAVDVAFRLQQELDSAINTGRLACELTVYRGIRSVRRTFGVEDAASIVSAPRWFRGFTATSVLRRVALDDFTTPAGALMEIALPAGTPALWVAGLGSRRLRGQGELLLSDRVRMRVVRRRSERGLVILAMEVVPR